MSGERSVAARLASHADDLTPADHRLAGVVLSQPDAVAFGTVADVAAAAEVGTATVTRFATKLGYDGYTDLQGAIRRELIGRLRPAAERIRDEAASATADRLDRHLADAVANVTSTLRSLTASMLDEIGERLADVAHEVLVLSGDASLGVCRQFATDLAQLRPGIALLDGNEIEVQRTVSLAGLAPTVVAVDVRRYDRWLLQTLGLARAAGAVVIAITDSVVSPVARDAAHRVVISADASGPFDSHVGTLAVFDLFVAEVARRERERAAERLDRLESMWRSTGALDDGG
jgi:DNA-binding MurR/RpiR family transcriptional regulator